ncbi:hypothetical protein [Pseudoxanthomonas suwonensis]|uniref:hypothetical protein n=1 Tax=Pseudoxanthomonas suwonensis TaxID=314722 RepID=UPI000698F9F1|nr:hypothetical protein [Pseudoxanthomonas suwonensis]
MPTAARTVTPPPPAVTEAFDTVIESLTQGLHRQMKALVGMPEQQLHDLARRYAPTLDLDPETAQDLRLLRVLLDGLETAQVRARNQEALETARQRAATVKHDLVARGELVPADELGKALGISRQAVHKGAKTGRLFAVEAGGREHYFPSFLAEQELRANGLEDVLSILGGESGWSKWLFFTTPSGALGGMTPLEALRERRRGAVQTAARAYTER